MTDDPRRQDTTVGAGIDFSDPNSKLAPFYITTTSVIFAGVLALIVAFYSHQPLHYTDVWAHLKHGDDIVRGRGFLLYGSPDGFTDPDTPRPASYWLSQVAYSGAFRLGEKLAGGQLAGGAELLRQLHTVAVAAFFALLWVGYRRSTGSGSLALLGLFLALAAALGTVGVHRPQLFALVGFAGILAILANERMSWKGVAGIVGLLVLWANLHGSFPVGLALLAIHTVGRAWDLGIVNALRDARCKRLIVAGVLAAGAITVANPMVESIWGNTLAFARNPNLRSMQEWQPLNFSELQGLPWFYWASFAVLAIAQALSPRPFSATEVLLTLVFGILPLFQERFMAWWMPIAIGILLAHLNAWADQRGWIWPKSLPTFRKTLLAAALVVFGCILTPLTGWIESEHPAELAKILHPATPVGFAEARANDPCPPRFESLRKYLDERNVFGPVFCTETLGEFLDWKDEPVMLFAHAHLFAPEYWEAAMQAKSGRPGWQDFFSRYGVNIVAMEAYLPNGQPQPLVEEMEKSGEWVFVVDERKRTEIRDPKSRLLVAVRKKPLLREGLR
jgi:hypothetical protein